VQGKIRKGVKREIRKISRFSGIDRQKEESIEKERGSDKHISKGRASLTSE